MKLFLEARGLIDDIQDDQMSYYIPLLTDGVDRVRQDIARELR